MSQSSTVDRKYLKIIAFIGLAVVGLFLLIFLMFKFRILLMLVIVVLVMLGYTWLKARGVIQ